MGGLAGVARRFALFAPAALAWLFADSGPPSGALSPVSSAWHLGLAASALGALIVSQHVQEAMAFSRETADFDAVMAMARPRQRALSIVIDRSSAANVDLHVYLHFPLWYQAERGGLVDPSFAASPPSIVRYRANPAGVSDDTLFNDQPERFDWRRDRGGQWTYFFVRARGPNPRPCSPDAGWPAHPRTAWSARRMESVPGVRTAMTHPSATAAHPAAARLAAAWPLRFLAPACGLALLALFADFWVYDRQAYFGLMAAWGVPALPAPFDDWAAVVQLMHCAQRGVNVYVASRCGTFSYGPFWSWARLIPMDSAWRYGAGLAIDAAFFASLWWVFRPRTWGAAALFALISISPMVVYGAERANADLILFVLVAAAGVLAVARRLGRADRGLRPAGSGRLAQVLSSRRPDYRLAGAAKGLRRHRRRLEPDPRCRRPGVRPSAGGGPGRRAVGALDGRWRRRRQPVARASGAWPSRALAIAATSLVVAAATVIALRLARRPDLSDALASIEPTQRTLLVLGGVIVLGFYLSGQPLAYHGVYLLPAQAGLVALRREASPALKQPLGMAAVGVLALMWEPAGRNLVLAMGPRMWVAWWLARELVGWGVIATLAAILVRFALDDGVIAALRGRRAAVVSAQAERA